MLHVLESTLEWTYGEVIDNSGIGSHSPCFNLDSASENFRRGRKIRFSTCGTSSIRYLYLLSFGTKHVKLIELGPH
jgi:hypothetical protein